MNPLCVTIIVSDPWDVGEAVKWQPIRGKLIDIPPHNQGRHALMKFDEPINYHGSLYHYAVVSPRRSANSIGELYVGKMVCCLITGISDQQAESDNPVDLGRWRGGLAFEGDVDPSS